MFGKLGYSNTEQLELTSNGSTKRTMYHGMIDKTKLSKKYIEEYNCSLEFIEDINLGKSEYKNKYQVVLQFWFVELFLVSYKDENTAIHVCDQLKSILKYLRDLLKYKKYYRVITRFI